MLEIKNLKKTFENGTMALRGVDLKVKEGEFLSILGQSGSGKTTLLRSINGLESIDCGEIFFDNKQINKTLIKICYSNLKDRLKHCLLKINYLLN